MAPNKKQLKTIEELERRINMCREFAGEWVRFNQILSAFQKPGVDKAMLEKEFLRVKSRVARSYSVLKDTLQQDSKIEATMMNIVYTSTDLDSVHSQSDVAVKKLQAEWNRSLMSIEETIGLLENKKSRAEAGEKVFLMSGADQIGGGGGGGGGGLSDKAKKNLIILAVVAALIAAIAFVPVPPFSIIREFYVDSFQQMTK